MDENDKKREFIQKEIIDKNYDKTAFINFCLWKKDGGDDLDNWTLEELLIVINEFQLYIKEENKYNESLKDKQNDIPEKFILKIIIKKNDYLDKKTIYLNIYFGGKSQTIKYNKSFSYEIKFELERKDFSDINNKAINVCIYESGLINDKYLGDFNIQLSELKTKKELVQKCKINLKSKKKNNIYAIVEVKLEELIGKEKNYNEKSNNKPNQIIINNENNEINDKKMINIEEENKNKLIKELNDKITNLQILLKEKEKSINEDKDKNKNKILNEKISNLEILSKEKEKLINEEKNKNKILNEKLLEIQKLLDEKEKNNQKLNEKILYLENIQKVKEEEINDEKKKFEELNIKFNNYQNIIGHDSKDEKLIKLLDDLESKDKEIKKLNEMKSRFPFELLENEKLMTVIIMSGDQKIHYSIICKNTEKFTTIEHKLYEKYPEYLESENYFLINGNKVNKYKSLDENKIKNSDIISMFNYDEM